ncbi:MAG TPA: carboxypeptidase regulatory-like domain-containing protein [Bryobacteraceae bacterium]|nr:carboxypeptidase regulatory-like domain-containing protein [Bryobacteraceae bacterium]
MSKTVALARLLVAAALTLGARGQPAGGFSLAGKVVNRVTGAPVRYAAVTLTPTLDEVQTDVAGSFQFSGLKPDYYVLEVSKSGFEKDEGVPVELGASLKDVVVRLTPLASIRGKALDTEGEPAEGVIVLALRSAVTDGKRRNLLAGTAQTDDRGEYRIAQLSAGRYLLKAAGRAGLSMYLGDDAPVPNTREAFAPTYFGGAHNAASALSLTVQPGAEARADLSLELQAGRRVRGRIANLNPYNAALLKLLRGDEDAGLNSSSLHLASGRFEIHGVLDGTYRLRALQVGKEGELLAGEQQVEVSGGDIDGVVLTLGRGVTIKGIEKPEGPPDESGVRPHSTVRLYPQSELVPDGASGHPFYSAPVNDGEFQIESLPPGKYRVEVEVEGPGYVSSARAGNTDLLASPELVLGPGTAPEIEVVLRTDAGGIEGQIALQAMEEDSAVALLVPEALNRPAETAPVEDSGFFIFQAVPPGAYRLYAWKDFGELEYADPRVLRALAGGGTRVEVKPGAVAAVQLQKLSEVWK